MATLQSTRNPFVDDDGDLSVYISMMKSHRLRTAVTNNDTVAVRELLPSCTDSSYFDAHLLQLALDNTPVIENSVAHILSDAMFGPNNFEKLQLLFEMGCTSEDITETMRDTTHFFHVVGTSVPNNVVE